MEQSKTEATRYHQKKRAEQGKKNEALKEKANSLAKEIQYLKYVLEGPQGRGKERAPS